MGWAEFYFVEGGLFFGFLVAAGLTVITLNRPDYRVARRYAWFGAILFGSIAIVWGITTPESAWVRIPLVGLAGLVAAVTVSEAIRYIRIRELPPISEPEKRETAQSEKKAPSSLPADKTPPQSEKLGSFFRLGGSGTVDGLVIKNVFLAGPRSVLTVEGSAKLTNSHIEDLTAIDTSTPPPPPKIGPIQTSPPSEPISNPDETVTIDLPFVVDPGVTEKMLLVSLNGNGLVEYLILKDGSPVPTLGYRRDGWAARVIQNANGSYIIRVKKKSDPTTEVHVEFNGLT